MEKKYIFVEHFQNERNETKTRHIYEMPEDEFAKIPQANTKVFEVHRFEELFSMLAENLFAFNRVITSYADKARIQSMFLVDYFQKRIDVNRAALNFFSTLFMYRDFVKKRFKDNYILDFFKNNEKYIRCEVMRNYIQHVESFPVNLNTSYSRCDLELMLASVSFQIDASNLKANQMYDNTRENFDHFFYI